MSIQRQKNETIIEYAKRLYNKEYGNYLTLNDHLSNELINELIANSSYKPKKQTSLSLVEQLNNAKFIQEIEIKTKTQLQKIKAVMKFSTKQLNIIQNSAYNKISELKNLYGSSVDLSLDEVKLCEKTIAAIEMDANTIKQQLLNDPINFDYNRALANISTTKLKIALQVRDHG